MFSSATLRSWQFRIMAMLLAAAGAANLAPFAGAAWNDAPQTAAEAVEQLGRGINLGNMLEAPSEGAWGVRFDDRYAKIIHDAGFAHVRLPMKWSAHAAAEEPYALDPKFVARVRHILKVCHAAQLRVVFDLHHYDEFHAAPEKHAPRLAGIWEQLAAEFADLDGSVVFEIMNEPAEPCSADQWNQAFPPALAAIRARHPRRPVLVGTVRWNNIEALPTLTLPADDDMLVATVHYYLPFEFTHQGATWTGPQGPPAGRAFPASDREPAEIAAHCAAAAKWSAKTKRPIYVGEFGAYSAAAMADRIRWTRTVAAEAARHKFATAYWEFCAGFGAWDPQTTAWHEGLRDAALGK